MSGSPMQVNVDVEWGNAINYYYQKVLSYNPIAFWRLNEASGTNAADSSGNGFDGTYSGVTLASLVGPDGENAPDFDGINDAVDVHSAGLAAVFDPNAFTGMAWIKVADAGVWTDLTSRQFFLYFVDGNNFIQVRKVDTPTRTIQWRIKAGGTESKIDVTGYASTDWLCIAFTIDKSGNELKAWKDGVQQGSTGTVGGTWAGSITTAWIGSGNGGTYWDGGEALVAIWDEVLDVDALLDLADTSTAISTDISEYVESVTIYSGFSDPSETARVANVGACTITLKNDDLRFSPLFTSGPYYGYLLPNKTVTVTATDGASTWTLFTGRSRKWLPDAGQYETLHCTLECDDVLGQFQDTNISLPLVESVTADYLLKWIGAAVFQTEYATGTVTFSANPSASDTVTIDGTVYTFDSSIGVDKVLIGTAKEDTAQYLADAINKAEGAGTTYGVNLTRQRFTADVDGAVVTLSAYARGAWGNAITLTESSAGITVSGATFSGGADIDEDFDAGTLTFEQAGDTWLDGDTNGLTAATDPTLSEYGLIWVARDGTLTFRNKDWQFTRYTATPVATITNDHNVQTGELSIDDVFTRSSVTYTPRGRSASAQVVAKANAPIYIPGTITPAQAKRYNPAFPREGGATKTFTIPYVEDGTNNITGADDLELPLDPTQDFDLYGTKDEGVGPELSEEGLVQFAAAPTGSGIELTAINTVARWGWVHNLQVRGIALRAFDPVTVVIDDTVSQALYGRREIPYILPLTSDDISNFAESLAQHLLNQNSTPRYRVKRIGFKEQHTAGGINVFSFEIGNVVTLTETQTAVSNQTYLIMGVEYMLTPRSSQANFVVRRVDDVPYWILEDADSQLGTNTYLGV